MTTKNSLIPTACFVSLLSLAVFSQWACTKKEIKNIAAPVITGVSKTTAHVGDTLTITGSGFSANTTDNIVSISSSALTIIQATPTQLVGVIPAAAQGGQLTVGLVGGPATSWPSNILIIGGIQPYITSVSPVVAFPGDTVIIHGGNFGLPASTNDVLISGTASTLLNVTDSVISMIVAEAAHTGNLTVTTNGSTSLPVRFTINRPNPLADGRLYWVTGIYSPFGGPSSSAVLRGADSVFSVPYSTTVYSNNQTDPFNIPGGSILADNAMNPMPADANGNSYFLYNIAQYGSPTTEYQLLKLTPGVAGSFGLTTLWDQDFSSLGASLAYPDPTDSSNYFSVPNTPDNISIDGNKMYLKLGITNSYYTADLSSSSPGFTTITGLLPDTIATGLQFGANYMFYKTVGSDNSYNYDLLTHVMYMQRGASGAKAIPLPSGEIILTTLADNAHGDKILIVTQTTGQPAGMKIYTFDASAETLQVLYSPSNWADATYDPVGGNQTYGLIWAGSHIYYANAKRHPYAGAGLYVLNDDGSSTAGYNVYPTMVPPANAGLPYLTMFLGKQ